MTWCSVCVDSCVAVDDDTAVAIYCWKHNDRLRECWKSGESDRDWWMYISRVSVLTFDKEDEEIKKIVVKATRLSKNWDHFVSSSSSLAAAKSSNVKFSILCQWGWIVRSLQIHFMVLSISPISHFSLCWTLTWRVKMCTKSFSFHFIHSFSFDLIVSFTIYCYFTAWSIKW